MPKKCIICGQEAKHQVKGTNNYYCDECADTLFGDPSLLVRVEEEARKLKALVDNKLKEES
jgi:hypothetical protein